ncbi:quinone-dependent dihydroorotate dehydrogenase [Haloglycomyces albus]|uniref:quinone-dependent dihydroorotate dehydrogenase n=1 Tax=Haloglycomyces albus TaxID=526067 RepID=UPI00046CAB3D|nr:quinone-dependent dihydroorotate dehydrogenase [Haloglycomyces albus]
MLYRKLARPALFKVGKGDPETAHAMTLKQLRRVSETPWLRRQMQRVNQLQVPVDVCGMTFPNPVGLAAGLDKNAEALAAWPALGFGFAEVGTVTAQAQPGNPSPRLFRLPESQALINRMGFNNDGAHAIARRLAESPKVNCPIGVSIGKTKITPLEEATEDYLQSLRILYPYASYFAVNVSSPNTPGLRRLQDAQALSDLLKALYTEGVAQAAGRPLRPIFLKLAPDLTESAIAEMLEVAQDAKVSGVIATNTTLLRDGVAQREQALAGEAGGLSGRPLTDVSRSVVKFIHRETEGRLPIIGSGGIMTGDDAEAMFEAGASLVQVYSGLIYQGLAPVKQGVKRYRRRLTIPPAHRHSAHRR